MTAVTEGSETHPTPGGTHAAPSPEPQVDPYASPVPVANAALIGLPTFLTGSIALALVFVGFVPQTLAGAPLAIIMLSTGIGQLTAMVFALKAGESAVASIFGIFSGFWLSYAALVLGILHNWFGLNATPTGSTASEVSVAVSASVANIVDAQKVFVMSWLILITILILVSLRLPSGFTLLFVLVDLALLFVYLGVVNASTTDTKVAGYFAFAFIALGAYLFMDAMSAATGGKNLPLGRPILK